MSRLPKAAEIWILNWNSIKSSTDQIECIILDVASFLPTIFAKGQNAFYSQFPLNSLISIAGRIMHIT